RADDFLGDAVVGADPGVVGDRHADAVEPAHEAEGDQQGDDAPGRPGSPLVRFGRSGGAHDCPGFGGWKRSRRMPLGSRRYTPRPPRLGPAVMSTGSLRKATPLAWSLSYRAGKSGVSSDR